MERDDAGEIDDVTSPPRIGPCPLHRCALEVGLAGLALVVGIALAVVQLDNLNQWLLEIPGGVRPFVQPGWGTLLVLSGLAQAGSVYYRWPRFPPHVAAMVATVAWLFVMVFAFRTELYLFAVTALWAMVAEFYVAGMLKP